MSEEAVEKVPFRILLLGSPDLAPDVQRLLDSYSSKQLDSKNELEFVLDCAELNEQGNCFLALRGSMFPYLKEERVPCWAKEGTSGYEAEVMKRRNYMLALFSVSKEACELAYVLKTPLSPLQSSDHLLSDTPIYFLGSNAGCEQTLNIRELPEVFTRVLDDVVEQCRNAWQRVHGKALTVPLSRKTPAKYEHSES